MDKILQEKIQEASDCDCCLYMVNITGIGKQIVKGTYIPYIFSPEEKAAIVEVEVYDYIW